MQLPLIIVIWPYGFRPFDWDRLELGELEKHAEVLGYELVEALTPHFTKAYTERLQSHKVLSSSSLRSWESAFNLLASDLNRRVVILNFIKIDSLKHLFVNWVLKKSGRPVVDYYQPGIPHFNKETKFFKRFRNKLKIVFQKNSWYSKYCRVRVNLCLLVGRFLKLNPTHRFVAGCFYENAQKSYCEAKGIKVISANSWDYTRVLRFSSQREQSGKYAILLDGAGPMFSSDALLMQQKVFFTSEIWYPALHDFLTKLEQIFGLTVKIAAHPKTKHIQFPQYFGGREVVSGKTLELVANAEFAITRVSTAVSYAVEFQKPIFFIYSDQLIADPESMSGITGMATELGTKAININGLLSNQDLEKLCTVNLDVYKKFKKNYLTSRFDRKPNYQILLDEIVNV